jgi:hypothetical protein
MRQIYQMFTQERKMLVNQARIGMDGNEESAKSWAVSCKRTFTLVSVLITGSVLEKGCIGSIV